MSTPAFTFIDLFAGIGGFRLALESLGGKCLNFSEIHNDAINTYCTNFREDAGLNLGDITKIKQLPQHDVLTAGVPCQSWSIAGKNLGFDDDRGQLWNDTLYLLNQFRPKAFIFENVKGLADPRNQGASSYVLARIRQAGYFAKHFVLNSSDYGVPQDRVRVYIVGFLHEAHLQKFSLPAPHKSTLKLADVLQGNKGQQVAAMVGFQADLFGNPVDDGRRHRKLSGMNDFFLFNDIRNGPTTIHSWDLLPTTDRQKQICLLMLRNRRKRTYGKLDGNPLSLTHLRRLDSSIQQAELDALVAVGILKTVDYAYHAKPYSHLDLDYGERLVLQHAKAGEITLDSLKECRELKKARANLDKKIQSLVAKGVLACSEVRYEFRYTKISTGIEGINRIFLPRSKAFPTLVASDTNDFVALQDIDADTEADYKQAFLREIFQPQRFRKISCAEACLIQGFPPDFQLPESRSRWMKLVGNSVSVPVIQMLGQAIMATGCLGDATPCKVAA
ncbi:DNA (cytosine-5-)-methyltransferase [Candidatus Thiothrix sp. Deng01]|uniref:Cytosine-specific methyltransferase n=1 Tax=Candidatus Thiothrix phosphatis TaxID=3112415 RepID=A0ABU6CTN6_9GAMM|nr:DNA (cytosine-5-)-methyltransferase [Candidatus Thiothrix sp. Deng01]MEB4589447.1 DNA (cytosine-5-)-methyltransferase [Candidatus Thiothrix sp. Deng01]